MALVKLPPLSLERIAEVASGITKERVIRSAKVRTLFAIGRLDPVRAAFDRLASSGDRPAPREVKSDLFPDLTADRLIDQLKRDGLAPGFKLPDDVRQEIFAWAKSNPCYGDYDKSTGFLYDDRPAAQEKAKKRFTLAHFFNLKKCPAIDRLTKDPLIHEVARRYVGPGSKLIAPHMWWSFATHEVDHAKQNEFAQKYHFDLDDYRFVKIFFYLTDVDEKSGPHVYVRGSHRGKTLRERYPMRRFTDAEVAARYGSRQTTMVGPAGTGFFADTYGIHKGEPPIDRDRLILEMQFGYTYYGFGSDEVPENELTRIV